MGDLAEETSIYDPEITANDVEADTAAEITGGAELVHIPAKCRSEVGKNAVILNKVSAVKYGVESSETVCNRSTNPTPEVSAGGGTLTTCVSNLLSIVDRTDEAMGTSNGIINHTSIKTPPESVDHDEASKEV